MELRHLRYFQTVAEELHFGRAAERLHIAQPPLSQQIRQLERELGVELFTRSTRRVELTVAGQAYYRRVSAILDSVDDAGQQAQRIAAGWEGHLSIGCVGSATYSLLPQLVRALRHELPFVGVSVRGEMLAPAQITALLAGEIDLALLRAPLEHPDIEFTLLRRDRLVAAVPDEHPLSHRKRLQIRDLRDHELIVHVGQGRSVMHGVVSAVCDGAGFVPRIRHEVQETSTLVTMVAAGLGVAIVPEPTSTLGIAGVRYVPLSPAALGVDLAVARAAHAVGTSAVDRAIAVLGGLVTGSA